MIILINFLSSLFISLFVSFFLIKFYNFYNFFQPERNFLNELRNNQKKSVPTTGGIAFFASLFFCYIFSYQNLFLYILPLIFALIGLSDDFSKIKNKNWKGISASFKFCIQFAISFIFCFIFIYYNSSRNYIPLINYQNIFLTSAWGALIITGSANAFNLTDGIDGLLGTLSLYPILFITLFISNNSNNNIFYYNFIAAILGFLFFNLPKAKIYMGDVGSLFLGSFIGWHFFIFQQELFLLLLCAIQVMETLSVIFQMFFWKKWKIKIFLMTPIHHHFEKLGWSAMKILIIFNIFAIISFVIACILRIKLF